jgi:hypothetical protein
MRDSRRLSRSQLARQELLHVVPEPQQAAVMKVMSPATGDRFAEPN